MATVKIDRFGGMMPRMHPSLLSDGMAVEAHNCRLKSGKLVPLRQPSVMDATAHTLYMENGLSRIADANSIHCWKHTLRDGRVRTDFLAFPGRVYFSHGNIADDEYDRVFVTGDTGVTFTTEDGRDYPNSPCVYLFDRVKNSIERHTLCKDEMDAPRCRLVSELDPDKKTYAYFFISWFDKYGYESAASLPSRNYNTVKETYRDEPLELNSVCTIHFESIVIPTAAHGVRIYKTNAGNETDSIQFVKEYSYGELPALANGFNLSIDDTQAGETMPEIEAPPVDLRDMTFVPGNFYAGRSLSMPHTVLFSDIDNPTNWALAYRYDVKDNVVKLAVTSNTVFALTDGIPYALSGTAPESMTTTALSTPAACVSEKAVCVHRNAVYFVSNYGLYMIANDASAGSVCQCVTDQFFTKEQWQALNPKSAIMGQFDNALHLFFTLEDGSHKAMIFDLADNAAAITTHDEMATCLCTDDRSDEMYFVRLAEEV